MLVNLIIIEQLTIKQFIMQKYIKINILLLITIIITFFLYFPTYEAKFLSWDDTKYITENSIITNISPENIIKIFSSTYFSNYHPITSISFALDYYYFNTNAGYYHLINIIIHIINGLLVFFFINKLFKVPGISLLSAVLFLVHPMHSESVAWISERKDLIYSMFFLCSMITYIFYLEKKKRKFIYLSFISFIFSLLSKSMATTLPLVLIMIDYIFYNNKNATKRGFSSLQSDDEGTNDYKQSRIYERIIGTLRRKQILIKIPFFMVSLVFGIIAYIAAKESLEIKQINTTLIFNNFFIICNSIIKYLIYAVYPYKLSAYHPLPYLKNGFLPLIYYLSPLAILGLIFIVLKYLRNRKIIIFGLMLFIITISVALKIIPFGKTFFSERYTYIPYLGLFLIMSNCIYKFISFISVNKSPQLLGKGQQKLIVNLVYFFFIIYLTVLSFSTFKRSKVWKDNISLYSDIISKYPECSMAYNNRGNEYINTGNLKNAESDLNKAIQYDKKMYEAYCNLGNIKFFLGKHKEALSFYNQSISINSTYSDAYNNRGNIYLLNNNYKEAIEDYSKAIKIKPDYIKAYLNRSISYLKLKQYKFAKMDIDRAIKLNSGDYYLYYIRALIFDETKEYNKAIKDYSTVVKLNPEFYLAYFNRGNSLYKSGNFFDAIENYNKVILFDSNFSDAYINRANSRIALHDTVNACRDLIEAIKLENHKAKALIAKYCKKLNN